MADRIKDESMSFEIDCAGWTEDELAAGVHILAAGLVDDSRYDDGRRLRQGAGRRVNLWRELFDKEGAEVLVSTLASTAEIRTRLSQYLLEGEKERIVERYAHRERLPGELRAAAQRSDAIPILIKAILRKVLGINPTHEVVREILELSEALQLNRDSKTVYDRVGDIQAYIHRKADESHYPGTHLDLPKEGMRHLLSSCRLHLSLQDMFSIPTRYWEVIWDAETAAAAQEAANPSFGFIPIEGRRIRLWRVSQMKPLTHFASPQKRAVLSELWRLPLDMAVEAYRTCALAALGAQADP
jgi:hypothetical protein